MTARCTRAASGAGRAGGPAPWHPAASLAVRPPGGQPGRPAAPPTHTTRPRGRRLRPAPPFLFAAVRASAVRAPPPAPPPPAPSRPQRAPVPPPRSAPEESLRRLPSPSPVVGPCRLPSQRTFLKREFSEIAFSETSFAKGAGYFLFRNVLYGGAGLFPFQKRPLRKGRAVSFSETSFAGVPDPPPLRSALRHARRHLGPSLPHLSRGHFPLRPLGLPSLEVDEVPCLPDSPCAPSASASVFVHAVSSASSCSSI